MVCPQIQDDPHRFVALTSSAEPGRYSIVQEIVQTVQGRSPDGDVPVQTTLLTVVYQLNERRSPSPSPSSSTASPVSVHDRYSLASCNVRFRGLQNRRIRSNALRAVRIPAGSTDLTCQRNIQRKRRPCGVLSLLGVHKPPPGDDLPSNPFSAHGRYVQSSLGWICSTGSRDAIVKPVSPSYSQSTLQSHLLYIIKVRRVLILLFCVVN